MEWTAERIALLKRLRDDGVSYAAIADKLGITRGAVSGKVDRLGLTTREVGPRGPRPPRAVLKRRRVRMERLGGAEGVAGFGLRKANSGALAEVPTTVSQDASSEPRPEARAEASAPWHGGLSGALWPAAPPARGEPEAVNLSANLSAQSSGACSLLDLTEDTCRWPIGDVGEPGFFFCGQPPLQGRPYCGPHCRVAFRPVDTKPMTEFPPDRDVARVLQPDTRFGQFAHWDVT